MQFGGVFAQAPASFVVEMSLPVDMGVGSDGEVRIALRVAGPSCVLIRRKQE